MNLSEYVEKIKKEQGINDIVVETKDIQYMYRGKNKTAQNKHGHKYYMELNIDEIEADFPIPDRSYEFNVDIKYAYSEKLEIVNKDGKFYPTLSYFDPNPHNIESIYLLTAYLKQLRKNHPEIEMPSILCEVYDYKLDKDAEIFDDYYDEIVHLGFSPEIIIDKNKKISVLIKIVNKNRDGIRIKKIIEKTNRNEIQEELGLIKKYKSIIQYKGKEYIGAEFNENNELVFYINKKNVDIDEVYDECLKECVEIYKENLIRLQKQYEINKSNVEKYKKTMKQINAINKNLDNYDNLSVSFSGRLKLVNKKERRVKPVSIGVNEGANSLYGNYLANIDDSMNNFDSYNIAYLNSKMLYPNLIEIMNKNKELTAFMQYVDYYFSSINNNLEKSEIYLNELEQQQSQIENQGIIKMLKDPIKLERKPLVSSYSKKQEEKIEEPLKEDPFMNLQRKQANNLNSEEKNSLMVYKTLLYRPINQIIIKKRTNGITDEEINQIINSSYKELKERLSGPSNPLADRHAYKADIGVINNGDVVPYEEYKKIVLDTIPMLEKSLKQVTLDEPLTVYRGVSTSDVNKDEVGILSTTIDSDIALSFLSDIRDDNGNSVVYKINLPEGSPVNFFSTELFIGKVDEEHSAGAFGDAQKEVLIDSGNYNFEVIDMKRIKNANIKRNNKTIYLVEINAHPKTLNMENNIENIEEERVR